MPSRRAIEWINACAALLALGLSTLAALRGAPPGAATVRAPAWDGLGLVEPVDLPTGGRGLADATGTLIPLTPHSRIASGSALADPLLLALASPEQIVAFSAGAGRARDAYRYAGKPSVDATRQLEQVIELEPDLVLVNSLGEHARVQRLRDAGLQVFDLGPMWGVQTFLRNVSAVGWLLGRNDAARELAGQFQARLDAIARHLPRAARRTALYVSVEANQLYGGTRGTSFHDVLEYAGLVDVAARDFRGWPSYDPEQLLMLNPELIVTHTGMRAALCEQGQFQRLRACASQDAVIEVDPRLLDDAGIGMLDCAELIHRAAYPQARAQ